MKQFFALLITLTFSALVLAQAPAKSGSGQWKDMDCGQQRIAAVGSTWEIRRWIGANTKVIDLQGKRVTPGFNDSHAHSLDGRMGLASMQLRGARTLEEFFDRIRGFAANLLIGRSDHASPRHKHWTGNAHNPSKNGTALVPA